MLMPQPGIGGDGINNVKFSYMTNDPVPVIAAGNPGEVWAALMELYNVVHFDNSAHSCYGTGAGMCNDCKPCARRTGTYEPATGDVTGVSWR